MGRINVLDKHLAELIAAGEVVERPASVVKELLENCIDANATAISVEIRDGGTTFIRVSDNGIGIMREDVPKAFLRNATSKVGTKDDLEGISTLGFRGEALASVAAVAKVELITKTRDADIGTKYEISGGEETYFDDCGAADGTTIIVKDLFYNTPARMKFLKKNVSEANAVAAVVDRLALSYPDISFSFVRDGKKTLKTLGDGKLSSCIYSVYGKSFLETLMPVDYELNGIKISGYISKPTSSRGSRSMQHFFINSRYVRTRTAMAAMEEAYKGSIMVGKFPACIMYISLPFEAVDVNVHPAKTEVRFINERPIFEAVYHGVKSALNKEARGVMMKLADEGESKPDTKPYTPEKKSDVSSEGVSQATKVESQSADVRIEKPTVVELQPEKSEVLEKHIDVDDGIDISVPKRNFIYETAKPDSTGVSELAGGIFAKKDVETRADADDGPVVTLPKSNYVEVKKDQEPAFSDVGYDFDRVSRLLSKRDVKSDVQQESDTQADTTQVTLEREEITDQVRASDQAEHLQDEEKTSEKNKKKLIGEIFDTYLLVQLDDDKLVFIDKHAAHERMLYEQLKEGHAEDFAQMLLTPVSVVLEKGEYDAVLSNLDLLKEAGFDVEAFGSSAVIVRSAPMYLEYSEISGAILEIAGYFVSHSKNVSTQRRDWLLHNTACRAAIKGGTAMKWQEMVDFIDRLEANPDIKYCPHGRPVSIILTKKEIEKKIGRIQ